MKRKSSDQDGVERTLNGGYKIERIGRGHYRCSSRSEPGTMYDIDIQANQLLGRCTCKDFECRRLPMWKDAKINYDHFRCKHLRAVRNHVLDQIIAFYSYKDQVSHETQ